MFNKYDSIRFLVFIVGMIAVLSDIGNTPINWVKADAAVIDYTKGQ